MADTIRRYLEGVRSVLDRLSAEEIEAALGLLREAIDRECGIYLFGNGGSAATASHLAVDLAKHVGRPSGRRVRIQSLTDNPAYLTALSNDLCYEDCFSEQLRLCLRAGDLVVGISASGDSPNVVRAFELAQDLGAERLALVGFDGGRLSRLATARVWVDSYDYGVVENVHLVLGHLFVRMLAERFASAPSHPDGAVLRERSVPVSAVAVSSPPRRAANIPERRP